MGLFSKKKYKFTDKKISRGGVVSSLFAVIALALVCTGIYMSYKAKGNGGSIVGILGTGATIISLIGMIVGVRSFKNENVFLGFPWLGVIVNSIVLICMMCIILIGV